MPQCSTRHKPARSPDRCATELALELRRIGGLGVPGQWSHGQGLKPEQAEGLRKLLVALAADVRLVLVRLALQLVRLRAVKTASREEQLRAALETREIYAPLASRLGIWQLKWELEDLAFRYAQPEDYRRIAGWLRATRAERERFIEDVRGELLRTLSRRGNHGRDQRAAEAHLQHLAEDGAQAAALRARHGRAGGADQGRAPSPTAMRRSVWFTDAGNTFRASSTTTSRHPRRTTTARCTPP